MEFTSISHKLAGILNVNGRVEVTNPHTLARTALWREPGTLATFERQVAIASVIVVVEYLADSLKLASAGNGGVLTIDAPASADAALAPVSKTPTVAATDTADTQGAPVAAHDGTVAVLDAAITPDGGLSDLTISRLPDDFVLPESEGDAPTVAHDTISLAFSEFTDRGVHGSSKDHTTALNVAAANSAEGHTAAKSQVAVSSHTTSRETGSDNNSKKTAASLSSNNSISIASIDANGGDGARIHSAVAGHFSDDRSLTLRGAASEHVNDQPYFGNAKPGQQWLRPSVSRNHRAKPPCTRLWKIHKPRQSSTATEAMRPIFTVPPRNTRRRSIPPRQRSRMTTPRASEARPPSM